MIYALWAAALAWETQRDLCPYLLIYALSFAAVAAWSLRESMDLRRLRIELGRQRRGEAAEVLRARSLAPCTRRLRYTSRKRGR